MRMVASLQKEEMRSQAQKKQKQKQKLSRHLMGLWVQHACMDRLLVFFFFSSGGNSCHCFTFALSRCSVLLALGAGRRYGSLVVRGVNAMLCDAIRKNMLNA